MPDPKTPASTGNPVLAKNHTVDAIVAILLLVVSIVVIVEARRLGAGWTTDGPGAGYFPFYVGLLLCISALGIFYQSVVGKSRDAGAFVDREQLQRVLAVFVPALVYVFAITFLGLYVASAIYIALFMIVLGKYAPLKSVVLAVVVNAVFFMMFEVWFKVPLFKGKLEPLAFLGY
jgi:Tripartite tricarboxylate transporter TctB family